MNPDFNEIEEKINNPDTALIDRIDGRVSDYRKSWLVVELEAFLERLFSARRYEGFNVVQKNQLLRAEILLREDKPVIFGRCTDGVDRVWGWLINDFVSSNPKNIFQYGTLNAESIFWTIPKNLVPKAISEINDYNLTGNYIVLRNKSFNRISDYSLINLRLRHALEIAVSRYSLAIQMKSTTFIRGEANSNDSTDLERSLDSDVPYLRVSEDLIPSETVITLNQLDATHVFKEIRDEFKDVLNSLKNEFGINTSGMVKESGVTVEEVESNQSVIEINKRLYTLAMNAAFYNYNNVFGTAYEVKI